MASLRIRISCALPGSCSNYYYVSFMSVCRMSKLYVHVCMLSCYDPAVNTITKYRYLICHRSCKMSGALLLVAQTCGLFMEQKRRCSQKYWKSINHGQSNNRTAFVDPSMACRQTCTTWAEMHAVTHVICEMLVFSFISGSVFEWYLNTREYVINLVWACVYHLCVCLHVSGVCVRDCALSS